MNNRIDFSRFKNGIEDFFPFGSKLGNGIIFAGNISSQIKITIVKEIINNHEILTIRGENRLADDWMGLEIDLNNSFKHLDITLRYAPTERIFPRLYYKHNGQALILDEVDKAASSDYATMRFEKQQWMDTLGYDKMSDMKLSLLFPNREWFALGISSIEEVLENA